MVNVPACNVVCMVEAILYFYIAKSSYATPTPILKFVYFRVPISSSYQVNFIQYNEIQSLVYLSSC